MPVYSAQEIYRFARMAGFSPDQACTMTAIALAESGGNSGAHNPVGENSKGLWQINVAAHTDLAGTNLYDPVENAKAAFRVSRGGQDVSPWTTTHRGGNAKYLQYRMEAETAARAAGDGGGHGNWAGTSGYGHPLSAGAGGGGMPANMAGLTSGSATGGTAADDFVRIALSQTGDRYIYGAETKLDDPDPDAFDCSELTQWAAHRAGVDIPDGAFPQFQALQKAGTTMSVEQALRTKGALLFRFSSVDGGNPTEAHVAISLGDGRTIEARGSQYGVGTFDANTIRFNYAGTIPQLSGPGTGTGFAASAAQDFGPAVDTDADGLIDGRERAMGTDASKADTDGDGLSDGYEAARLRTSGAKADTDGDGIGDAFELAAGSDPNNPDSDRDGIVDGDTSSPLDTDHDGLSDRLEQLIRSDPLSLDSDRDGFTDGLEYQGRFDPTDPLNNPATAATSGGPGTDNPAGGLSGPGLTGNRLVPGNLTGDPTAALDDFGAS